MAAMASTTAWCWRGWGSSTRAVAAVLIQWTCRRSTARRLRSLSAQRSWTPTTTGFWFDLDEAYVPKEVVREYARIACLCRLRKESAPDGPLLRDVFLHHPPAYAEARRLTLRMLLDIAVQTDGHAVDEDAFRRLLFFGATGDGATFAPRTDLDHTAAKWRLYQAREYYVFALTGIWCHLCDWGLEENGDLRPVSLDAVTAHVEESLATSTSLPGVSSTRCRRLGATSPFESCSTSGRA